MEPPREGLISIVVRTHDRPVGMVAEAARSALCQSRAGDYEVVVVHSGPDRGRIDDMLAELDPGRRRARQVHVPEAAGNRAASCNAGAEAARGEWIRYLDDDDLLAPTALSIYRRRIAETAGALPIICSDVYVEHAAAGRRRRLVPRLNSAAARGASDRIEQTLRLGLGTAILFCRRSLLASHPHDTGYPAMEDAEWLWRTVIVGGAGVDFLPAILTRTRWHDGNTAHTVGADRLAELERRAAAGAAAALRAGGRAAEADRFEAAMRRTHRRGRLQARARMVNACSRSRIATRLYLRRHGVHDAFGLA